MKTVLILLGITSLIFGQYSPTNYLLERGRLAKVSNTTGDATPASNSIQDIIVKDNLIILGTSRGLSLSEDDGESWNNFYQKEPFGSDGTTAIGYDNGVIWTTTGRSVDVDGSLLPEGTGIKYSVDNGATWITIIQPVDDPGDSSITYGINQIRALPVTTTISNISYDISFTKNTIWIASFAGGLRKSTDMGVTWERVVLPPDTLDSISPNDTLGFSLQPVAGAFGAESWLNHRVFSVLGVDDSTLYVGTAGGINKSTDNGISWRKFSHQNQTNPISGNFVVALGNNESDNSIWAATWKAENLDEFWGVSYSFDGGENWEVALPEEKAHNFGFKYLDGGDSHVFVPTDNGIYRSNNNGASWAQPSLIRDSYTNVPIATNIFYSATSQKINAVDYKIWIGSNNGLVNLTESNGFWEGDWKVFLASSEIKSDETYAFPNPFSPAMEFVKIKYVLKSDANVTIRIMNFSMDLVKVLVQNTLRGKGELFEVWDGRNEIGNIVKNGVYFYRIDADGLSKPLFGKIMVMK
jgi:ligand-binding sensor domain-containing protein